MTRLAIVVLLSTATAAADPSSKAKADASAAYAEGQRRYLAEDYAGAALQFRIAYSLDPDPAYLFNIAQAYRFGKQCKRAVTYYRRFFVIVPDPPNKADVVGYVTEMQSCAATQPEPPPEPSIEPERPAEPVKPTPVVVVEQPVAEQPSRTRKLVGLSAIAVGAIGVGVGVAFSIKGKTLQNDREALCDGDTCGPNAAVRSAQLASDGHRANVLAITGYAVGAVALGTGLWLYLSDRKSPARRVRSGAHSESHPPSSHHVSMVLAEETLLLGFTRRW